MYRMIVASDYKYAVLKRDFEEDYADLLYMQCPDLDVRIEVIDDDINDGGTIGVNFTMFDGDLKNAVKYNATYNIADHSFSGGRKAVRGNGDHPDFRNCINYIEDTLSEELAEYVYIDR